MYKGKEEAALQARSFIPRGEQAFELGTCSVEIERFKGGQVRSPQLGHDHLRDFLLLEL